MGARIVVTSAVTALVVATWSWTPCAGQAELDARAVLERVAEAHEASYSARQLVAYFPQPQSVAVLDVTSWGDGRFVRASSGGASTRLWSESDVGILATGGVAIRETSPAGVPLQVDAVMTKYEVEVGERDELLGVEVVPVTLVRRRDDVRVERWWVHPESGVTYRRDLYGPSGELVGMSTIIEMEWGDPFPTEQHDPADDEATSVRKTKGSDAPRRIPESYELSRTYQMEVDGKPTEHWVYSDGLHALSVFQTKGGLKAPAAFRPADVEGRRLWVGPGPGTWAWEGDGRSWLLVAEEPALDAARITEPFPKGGPSIWARMGSLWTRLGGAIRGVFS